MPDRWELNDNQRWSYIGLPFLDVNERLYSVISLIDETTTRGGHTYD